jgi:hypothetical protein
MTLQDLQARKATFDTMLSEGRVIRGAWKKQSEGQYRACLLAAWSPEVSDAERASACPSWLMPAWLAELTPWMDDNGSDEAWPSFAKRYGNMVWAARVLDEAAWDRAFKATLKLIVDDAMASKEKAAKAAAKSAAEYAKSAAEYAKSAAKSAKSAESAKYAAEYAKSAESAKYAAKSAEYAKYAAESAADYAEYAVDRISNGILDIIEAEISKTEEKMP